MIAEVDQMLVTFAFRRLHGTAAEKGHAHRKRRWLRKMETCSSK
jgi:hypothetical protein